MNTTHYAQKNVLYLWKKCYLACQNLQIVNSVEKAMDDTVTLLWLCKICRYIWNQCVNGGGRRWDVCYKLLLWAIGTISNVLKQVTHALFPQLTIMSGVVAKHILHTQWGGILPEQHLHKTLEMYKHAAMHKPIPTKLNIIKISSSTITLHLGLKFVHKWLCNPVYSVDSYIQNLRCVFTWNKV